MEIKELKNTITQIKTHWMGSIAEERWQRIESVNLRTDQASAQSEQQRKK